MIYVDGVVLEYTVFPDKTVDIFEKMSGDIRNLVWEYHGDLSEAFVCLHLLCLKRVAVMEFRFLPFARQDKVANVCQESFSILSTFLNLFKKFEYTRFMVMDAHNPDALPLGWMNYYNPFVIPKSDTTLIIFPDHGAGIRYGKYYKHIDFIAACKIRDPKTGSLVISLPRDSNEFIKDKTLICVVDDICDGGATFIELAKLLPEGVERHLLTTYGIYSKGVGVLEECYNLVKCQYKVFG